MRVSELATVYAKAIFEGLEQKDHEQVLANLRAIDSSLSKENEVLEYLASPIVDPKQREALLETAMKNAGAHQDVQQLLLLLARNNRFAAFSQIVEAYQNLIDEENGVIRGTVRSASNLGPDERQKIEAIVEKVLKKKVIMTYKTDPSVIGGLVAQAGSFTFDDSLDSHLTRLNEELKRKAH